MYRNLLRLKSALQTEGIQQFTVSSNLTVRAHTLAQAYFTGNVLKNLTVHAAKVRI